MAKTRERKPIGAERFVPIPVGELEVTAGSATVEPNELGQICLLVRVHGVPLGVWSVLDANQSPKSSLYNLAVMPFAESLTDHLVHDGLPWDEAHALSAPSAALDCAWSPAASSRLVSAVVCTLGEDPRLIQTVTSILAQTHSELELLVVDNNPGTGGVRSLLAGISDSRMRVVTEPRRGLSAARNTALRVAAGSIIAYTDDDAYADPNWIRRLIAPFDDHDQIVCVTGLVLPAELATAEQVWFEEFGAFDKGFTRTAWSEADNGVDAAALGELGNRGALFPYSAGVFGSGNNMAFRTKWLRQQKLFDEALGAGTASRGGEDLDAFLSAIRSGAILIYEPQAIIKHHARRDFAGLRKQMYGYGSGMSAVITKHFFSSPRSALKILSRVPQGLRRLVDPSSEKNVSKSRHFPKELSRAELAGFVCGPFLYIRSLWAKLRD